MGLFVAKPIKPGMELVKLEGDYKTREVRLNGNILSPERSLKVRNHSPDGFSWGYSGSGCSQLALAILLECMSEKESVKHYQNLKANVIQWLPESDFTTVIDVLEKIKILSHY